MSAGKVFPSITANGREGVWRLLHIEYHTPRDQVLREMEDDISNLQPESENFILVELQSGMLNSSYVSLLLFEIVLCL